jgi:hypothetical protein
MNASVRLGLRFSREWMLLSRLIAGNPLLKTSDNRLVINSLDADIDVLFRDGLKALFLNSPLPPSCSFLSNVVELLAFEEGFCGSSIILGNVIELMIHSLTNITMRNQHHHSIQQYDSFYFTNIKAAVE